MQDRFKFKVKFEIDGQVEIFDVIDISFESQQVFFRRQDNMVYNIGLGVKGVELIQCTGLKDDNGKLMYEGDIVKIWKFSKDLYGNDKRVIKWNNARCGFRLYTIDHYKRGIVLYPQSMVNVTTIEVIVNIFQNPELLKDGE